MSKQLTFLDAYLHHSLVEVVELALRFGVNFLVAYIIINKVYYISCRNKEFFFTFYIFNTLIFFICYIMDGINASTGFGLGLFAVFSILRYRTGTIPTKEMTYLFIVISVGLINSLANNVPVTLLINAIIILLPYYLEKNWHRFQESVQVITYEKIEMIQPSHREELLQDLRQRTGLNIHRAEVVKIDFLKDVAQIKLYYNNNQK